MVKSYPALAMQRVGLSTKETYDWSKTPIILSWSAPEFFPLLEVKLSITVMDRTVHEIK